jgi:hypothetical protein
MAVEVGYKEVSFDCMIAGHVSGCKSDREFVGWITYSDSLGDGGLNFTRDLRKLK